MTVLAASAMATEVGIRGTHTPDASADTVGVTLGKKFGAYGVEAAFDRGTRGNLTSNKYSLVGSYDMYKVNGITFAPKVGVSFIDPSNSGRNGYALSAGVGATYPLTKEISLVADYAYQRGQYRVRSFNGNQVSVGAKYSF